MSGDSAEVLIKGNINALSDRAAMGLPSHYVKPALDEELGAAIARLGGYSAEALAARAEEPGAPLAERLAAGTLLGLAGDPRIDTLNPPMIEVPGGRVLLGTQPEAVDALYGAYRRFGVQRNWIEKECPRFTLELAPFRIGRYPVTNGEYEAFLLDTEHPELPSSWSYGRMPLGLANHPVYTVTAASADAYAAWLARKTGRRFRLPTEFEWEYAAAGPEGWMFPWGSTFDTSRANTMELRLLTTTPVGIFPQGASPFGALDMAGNVEEFVSSTYQPYPGWSIVEDDLWKLLGHYRIARGGAFNRFQDLARCQRRHGAYPKSLYAIGFRLAEDLAG